MNYYLFHFLSFSFLLLFLDPLNTINAGKPFEPTSTVNCEVRHLKSNIERAPRSPSSSTSSITILGNLSTASSLDRTGFIWRAKDESVSAKSTVISTWRKNTHQHTPNL
ncbi:Chitinase 1 [Fusarium oxysporum f. sp. albedinis]|nr:Chitinase 1 [Fusarium oxysporum f. sp. albedinis]